MASQMYMWETLIPGEEDAFEEDVIASTNEGLYVAPLTGTKQQAYEELNDDSIIFFDPNEEAKEFRGTIAFRQRESDDIYLELDLELDLSSDIELDLSLNDDCTPA